MEPLPKAPASGMPEPVRARIRAEIRRARAEEVYRRTRRLAGYATILLGLMACALVSELRLLLLQ